MRAIWIKRTGIVALAATIFSCGGGGSTSPGLTVTVQGTVDPLYGTAPLTIFSSFADQASATSSNGFAVEVSNRSAELLVAQDAEGKLRSLTVYDPASQGGPLFSADSTATALIFSTPRIYAADPNTATGILTAIRSLTSYATFANLLKGHETETLETTLSNAAVADALEACIEEWFTTHPSHSVHPNAVIEDASKLFDSFNIILNTSDQAQTKIHVENPGFRILEVRERDIAQNGTPGIPKKLSSLSGAASIDYLNLFTGVGEPSKSDYTVDLGPQGSIRSELYFRGPGSLKGASMPTEVRDSFGPVNTGLLKTTFWYVILPLLDSTGGIAKYLDYKANWVTMIDTFSKSATIVDDLATLDQAIDSASRRDAEIAAIHLTFDMLDSFIKDGYFKDLVYQYYIGQGYSSLKAAAKAGVAEVVAKGLIVGGLYLKGAQLSIIVKEWQNWHQVNMASFIVEGSSSYAATDIGTLGGHTVGTSINKNGYVVGKSVASDGLWHSFFYDTSMKDLGWLSNIDPNHLQSCLFSINDNGAATGSVDVPGSPSQAYLWTGSNFSSLNGYLSVPNNGMYPYAINATNDLAGLWYKSIGGSNQGRAFTITGGTFHDLHDSVTQVGDLQSQINAMNDSGQMAGTITDSGGYNYAFFYSPTSTVQPILVPGGVSQAIGISNSGYVTGVYATTASATEHKAFIWKTGKLTQLQDLNSNHLNGSYGRAVDDSGTVVGDSLSSAGDSVACIWKNGVPKDLNTEVSLAGVRLTSAVAINGNGYILCLGTTNGSTHTYVLKPY